MKKGQGKIYDSYYANFIGDTNNFLYSFTFFFSFCILKREHKIKKGIFDYNYRCALSGIILVSSYIGYCFLAPQFGMAMEQEKVLSGSKKIISDFKDTQNAVKVSIGKFSFDPADNEAFDGEIYNEKGGVPITLKNTANYHVIADVEVVAYDEKGNEIETQALGTAGDLKAGETKTFWLFRSIMKESDINKYKSATYRENKEERMTTKMEY
ncbi:hypothetical protein LLT6_01045 [Lactococcus cremoris subsp. cremoris TIFN6]|uniref:Uncharacterized protein n=1 Tax=Lactococcus cremoris subsp. cremoris TIFN6 TaxID=1234876 RepID=T0S743_LACLC|nr:hypothetical protein LLT6_01045 [Lactococcus cremoris subsp. cremoris TIFN6]